MQEYRIETVFETDGVLNLKDLPFKAGARVEIVIISEQPISKAYPPYSLYGTPITYLDPTEPVAQDDWEAEN